MDKLLSIIIPVYNVEKYIRKCLDSLILPADFLQMMEVIIVNDGTPDNSAVIAKEYEKKYSETFRVIDKENGGHGSAWNRGLEVATGKYVRFLDSDDWFDTDNLAKLIHLLLNTDVDIVFTKMQTYYAADERYEELNYFTSLKEGKVYDADTYDWNPTWGSIGMTNFHHCTYRREMFSSVQPLFLEHQRYDDTILFVAPVVLCKSFVFCNMIVYNYFVGREGQTATDASRLAHFDELEKVKKQIIEFVRDHPVTSATKSKKLEMTVSALTRTHFDLLRKLDYAVSKVALQEWSSYLNKCGYKYKKSKLELLYHILPFALFRKI